MAYNLYGWSYFLIHLIIYCLKAPKSVKPTYQLRAVIKCGKIFWISISDILHKNVRQSFLTAPQSGSEFEACWWSIAALCGKDLSNWWGRAGDWCTIFNLLQKSQDRWLPRLALFSGGIIGQTIHSLWNDVEKIKSPREKNAETIIFFNAGCG